ncbi:MAG: hypothetical protein HY902_11605 [Deltaproteobacteria bacterium]|nr:hypothetical protein [Deltaproteobacteria bacterium]
MNLKASRHGLDALAQGKLAQRGTDLLLLCDGTRDLDALQADFGCTRKELLAQLDVLADAGLLLGRAAPPTGVSRRGLLGSVLGATAALAVTSVARKAHAAADAGAAGEPLACSEEPNLDLDMEVPTDAELTGMDPAPLLALASKLQVGALDSEIASADLAKEEEAAAVLADMADAYATLTGELAAEGLLEYTEAAALGDFGPLGREGDMFSALERANLGTRERRAKHRHREQDYKAKLAGHDEESLAKVSKAIDNREVHQKGFAFETKQGAMEKETKEQQAKHYEYAQVAYKKLAEAARKNRELQEEQKKQENFKRLGGGKLSEAAAKAWDKQQVASLQLLDAGTAVDTRSLDASLAWALADVPEYTRISEKAKKARLATSYEKSLATGRSALLAKRADEMVAKRNKQQAALQKQKADERDKKQLQPIKQAK